MVYGEEEEEEEEQVENFSPHKLGEKKEMGTPTNIQN